MGAIFCLISAILISAKYIAAAICVSAVNGFSKEIFAEGLTMIGTPLSSMSLYALIAGIVFLGYGIFQDIKNARKSE